MLVQIAYKRGLREGKLCVQMRSSCVPTKRIQNHPGASEGGLEGGRGRRLLIFTELNPDSPGSAAGEFGPARWVGGGGSSLQGLSRDSARAAAPVNTVGTSRALLALPVGFARSSYLGGRGRRRRASEGGTEALRERHAAREASAEGARSCTGRASPQWVPGSSQGVRPSGGGAPGSPWGIPGEAGTGPRAGNESGTTTCWGRKRKR